MEDNADCSAGRSVEVSHISTLAASIVAEPTEWKKKTPLKTYSKKLVSPSSPSGTPDPDTEGKSRYGRTRKLRPAGDFLSTDRKVSQYMKINYEDQIINSHSTYSNSKTFSRSTHKEFGGPRTSLPARLPSRSDANPLNGTDSSEVITSPLDIAKPTCTETIDTPLPLQECETEDTDSEAGANLEYQVGDLVWAAVPGYPYWPAMITRDPITDVIVKLHGGRRKQWHVYFFGDRGFRGWVYNQSLFPFDLETYNNKKSEVLSVNESELKRATDKKTVRQQKKLFTIIDRYQNSWNLAVSESQSLVESPRDERLEYFATTYLTKKEPKMRSWSSTASLASSRPKKGSIIPADFTDNLPITPAKEPKKRMRSWSSTVSLATDENKAKRRKSDVPMSMEAFISHGVDASPFKLPTPISSKSPQKTFLMPRSKVVVRKVPAKQRTVSTPPVLGGGAVSPLPAAPRLIAPINSPGKKHPPPTENVSPQKKSRVSKKSLKDKEETSLAVQSIKSEAEELLGAATSSPAHQHAVASSPAEVTPTPVKKKRGRPRKYPLSESAMSSPLTDTCPSPSPAASKNVVASPRVKKQSKKSLRASGSVSVEGATVSVSVHSSSPHRESAPAGSTVESALASADVVEVKIERDETPSTPSPPPTITRSGRKSVKPEVLKPTFKSEKKQASAKAESPPTPTPAEVVVKQEPASPEGPRKSKKKQSENTPTEKKGKKKKPSSEEIPQSENADLSKPVPKLEIAPKLLPKKACALFAGVKDTKLCSVCFKGEKVVRCRGPCSLYMHVECGDKPRFVPGAAHRESDRTAGRTSKKRLGGPGRGNKRKNIERESDDTGSLNGSIKEEIDIDDSKASVTDLGLLDELGSGVNGTALGHDDAANRILTDDASVNGVPNDEEEVSEVTKTENQLSRSASPEPSNGPTSPERSNGPTSPERSNGPTSPERTNGPTSPEQTNEPTSPEQTDEPTRPERTNGSTSPERTNGPTSPDRTNGPTSPEQTNRPTSSEQTNEPTSPKQTNEPTSPERTNGPTSPEQHNGPTSAEPVLEPRAETVDQEDVHVEKMVEEKPCPIEKSCQSPIKSCSGDDEVSALHDVRASFPDSSGIPTPPPEENGKSPVREETSRVNGDVDMNKTMDVDGQLMSNVVNTTAMEVDDRLPSDGTNSTMEVDDQLPSDVNSTMEVDDHLPSELNLERLDAAESTTSDSSEKEKNGCASSKKDAKEKGWMCSLCVNNMLGPCFACGNDDGERVRCKSAVCGKVFHLECMKAWPQHSLKQNARGKMVFNCPAHTCHTCISDNPSCLTSRYLNDKLVRCMKCPTTYHHGNHCVPAGSEILTSTQIICPRHFRLGRKSLAHLNASWCFLCSMGGSLICCDLCPTAFHVECLKISPPEGAYICEDCETGRFPLYGEIVWVKLGFYRWWPARIPFPFEIPPRLLKAEHVPGEFAVRFYGTYDYYWVNRGRVFLFHEGDGKKQESINTMNNPKKAKDEAFHKGVREANEDFIIWNEKRNHLEESHRPTMKPPKYTKITSNKPFGSVKMTEADASSLTACECSPDAKDPCGPDSDCINRLLLVECDPETCPAKDKCKNRNFEQRLYPPLVAFRTESRGWGLKTLGPLKKGDFIIEYVGEMIDEEEYQRRLQEMQKNKDQNFYFLTLDKDRMLDAGPKGNLARFMNHSCQPNCETQKWTVEGNTRVGLFALQEVPADSELVFNYNLMTTGDNKIECRCGAPNCAGYIGGKPAKPQNKLKDDSNSKSQNGRQNKIKKKRKSRKAAKNLAKIALTNASLNALSKADTPKCSMCNENGATIACRESQCPKMYHLACTHLTKEPKHYTCPSHECSTCRSRSEVENCSLCINSYCSEHQEGNMVINREKGPLCRNCYESDSGSEWSMGGKDDEATEPSTLANET